MATWPSWVRQVFREKFWKSFKLRKHSELQTLCQKLLYSLRKSQRGCLFTFSSLSRFCCSTSSRSPTNRFTLKKREGHYKSLFLLTFVLGRVWDETRKFVKSVNFYKNKKIFTIWQVVKSALCRLCDILCSWSSLRWKETICPPEPQMSWSYSPNESSASATKSCFAFNVEYMRMRFMKNMQSSVFNVFISLIKGCPAACNVIFSFLFLTMIGCRSLILLVPSRGSWKWNHCQRLTIYIFCHCSSKYTYQNKELHVSEWYLSFISCAGNRHNADTPTHTTSSLPDVESSSSSSWSWLSW